MTKTVDNKAKEIIIRSCVSFALIATTVVIVAVMAIPKDSNLVPEEPPMPLTVETVSLVTSTGGIDFKVDGEVVPYRSIDITPEVAGRVVFKSDNCRLGKYVQKDELLLEIDSVDYSIEERRLTESVALAENSIKELEVQIENTKTELEFAKEQQKIKKREHERYISPTTPGVYSDVEVDNARSSLITADESVQKLENQLLLSNTQIARLNNTLEQEKVNLELAKLNLKRTKIYSPISGVVTNHSFELDSYLQKGTSVATIQDTSRLEIQCSLHMKQMLWLWQNPQNPYNGTQKDQLGYVLAPTEVTITYELDGVIWAWEGRVTSYEGAGLNALTRMMPCRITVDDPMNVQSIIHDKERFRDLFGDGSLKVPPPTLLSGMFVSIIIHAKPEITFYIVPEKAILPGDWIWAVSGGILKRHQVRVATSTPQGVMIYADAGGPGPSDLVVVSPIASGQDGDTVEVVPTTIANNKGTENTGGRPKPI